MFSFSTLKNTKYLFSDVAMSMRKDKQTKIVHKLQNNLTPTYLSVKDTTLGTHSCGPMYKITIESPAFLEKSKLQQHKMVMNAISDDMQNIHAVNLKTRTPSSLNLLNLGAGQISQELVQDQKI